jgi:hypothetical protein
MCHYSPFRSLSIYYLFGIVIGLERAGGQPCRLPPFGTLDQLLDKSNYCITAMACKATDFRPGGGVEIEPDAHFLAIDTKVAFTIASLLLGIASSSRTWFRRR